MRDTIRQATIDDIGVICQQRRAMFDEMGVGTVDARDAHDDRYPAWLREQLEHGHYIGWFVEEEGQIAAGAGLWLIDWQPTPRARNPLRGYVLNVYTEPGFRYRGYARRLMTLIIDYAREHHIETLVLHASDMGEALYKSLGFTPTNEFSLKVE